MTQIAYPLDNTDYTAADVRLFHAARHAGIFNATGTDLQVSAEGGLNVSILPGVAFLLTSVDAIGGITYLSNQTESFTVATPGSTTRYDYISVRYTLSTNRAELTYVRGGSSKSSPARNQTQYEIIIAIIEVPANATQITQANIQDTRLDANYCGLVVDGTERVPIEGLQAQFQTFMDSIKSSLGGDVAGNLLNRINENSDAISALNITKVTWGTVQKPESEMQEGELFLLLKG